MSTAPRPALDANDSTGTRRLLASALRGQTDAERHLWEFFHPHLVARAARHPLMGTLRPLWTPEDVAGEVWVRVYSQRSLHRFEYRGPGSLGAYLGRILDRTLHDCVRRAQSLKRATAKSTLPLIDGVAAIEPVAADPPASAQARHGELLALCRNVLDERLWTIFDAIEVRGSSSVQVGEQLGIPASSVRRLLADAKERLTRML